MRISDFFSLLPLFCHSRHAQRERESTFNRKLESILIFSLLYIIVFALPIYADPGFYTVGSSEIPTHVSNQSNAVFRIYILAPRPSFFVSRENIELYRNDIASNPPGAYRYWKRIEIQNLQNHPVYYSYDANNGTAFLVKNNRTLLTAGHLFDAIGALPSQFSRAKTYQEAQKSLMNHIPPFVVVNQHDQIVYDTRNPESEDSKSLRIGFNGHSSYSLTLGSSYAGLDHSSSATMTDLIELQLGRNLNAKPFEFATSTPAFGAQVFKIGFPVESKGRYIHQTPDSDGESLRIAKGKVIDVPQFYIDFLNQYVKNSDAISVFLNQRITTDVDAVPGTSGAPIVDTQGKVVGLFNIHWPMEQVDLRARYYDVGGQGPNVDFLTRALSSCSDI